VSKAVLSATIVVCAYNLVPTIAVKKPSAQKIVSLGTSMKTARIMVPIFAVTMRPAKNVARILIMDTAINGRLMIAMKVAAVGSLIFKRSFL